MSAAARLRAFYFLYYGGVGATLPYLAPYLRGLGFSGEAIGTVQMLSPLVAAPAALGWAAAADRLGAPARALAVAALWSACAAAFLPIARTPLVVGAVVLLQALAERAVVPLADSITLEWAREHDRSYARVRLFGSIGFIALAQGLGLLLWARGDRGGDVAVPIAIALTVAAYAVAARRLPAPPAHTSRPRASEALALLADRRLLSLLLVCGVHWAACAPFHLLFGVFVRDAHLPAVVTGLGMTAGVGAEVLALAAFPRLEGALRTRALFAVAFAATAVRWALLARARGPATIVLLQVFHGLTFGVFWGASMRAMSAVVPRRLRATGQALYSAVVFGGGNAVGYQLAGLGYDRLGGVGPLFGWAAAAELVPLVAALALARSWEERLPREGTSSAAARGHSREVPERPRPDGAGPALVWDATNRDETSEEKGCTPRHPWRHADMASPGSMVSPTGGSTSATPRVGMTSEERLVIFASSLGTVFEWYDFYLYGSLAAIISKQFFSALNETSAFIFALLAFAAGFAVRPFGAIVFGRLGDLIGRKYTFLITILIMGLSTFIVGLLPSYATIGVLAPVVLIGLRLLQGLALGGEYGGAATYVAEHAPPGKRGFFTSWIQTTATVGLFLSLLVILACRTALGPKFDVWGWRIPFILSAVLLAISVYIRLKLNESPVFKRMKAEGKQSKAPLTESFLRWGNLKIVLLILFGGTAGQAVVWYTGMFYELFFLQQTLKVDPQTANILVAIALILATPFFIVFGVLSDKIGRKHIIMAGCVLAAVTYFPIFKGLTRAANPAIFAAEAANPVTIVADPRECSFQFDPIGKKQFTTSCDIAKSWLAKRAIPYKNEEAPPGTVASVRIGSSAVVSSFPGLGMPSTEFKARSGAFDKQMGDAVKAAGYPAKADPSKINYVAVVALLWILAVYVTIVYAPIAAWLVELFPARIRYTSMSLPYHIGNGWFGGFLPTIAFAMVAATGDVYYGLWYPIVIALMTAVIGTIALPETKDREIHHA